jgi:probable O-glycosylation ligase (exosortase A-associated)
VFRLLFVLAIILAGIYYSMQGAFYVLLFYLWNGYFRPEEWVWSSLVMQMRLSLAIGSMLVLAAIPSLRRFRPTTESWLIILFFLQGTISWQLSPFMGASTYYWVEFCKVIIVTLLITILVDDLKKFRLVLAIIALSLGLEAAKQGWAQLILNPGAVNVNTHLVLGDNNGVALGMMMLVPVFIALARTSKTVWERRIHHFFLLGVLYRGISTYSRGGLLAALAVSLVVIGRSKHRIRGFLLVGLLAMGAWFVMPQQFWDRMASITASPEERDASAASRLYIWGLATEVASDYPITGVGLNAFRYVFRYYDRTGEQGDQRATHSIWFGTLADLGYPGLILFVLLVGRVLLKNWQIERQARRSGHVELGIYASTLQFSLIAYLVAGTFLSAHYLELVWHVFGLTVALTHIANTTLAGADSSDATKLADRSAVLARVPASATAPSPRAGSGPRQSVYGRQAGSRDPRFGP